MEDITVTVLRTHDASKCSITIPLSATLNTLKDKISKSSLGPIGREYQRIFHLGREFKSGRRSLSALGFGKFGIFVIHLHSTAPPTIDLAEEDDKDKNEYREQTVSLIGFKRGQSSTEASSAPVIDLLDDDGDEEEANNGLTILRDASITLE